MDGYDEDPETKQTKLSLTGSNDKRFSLEQGVIRLRGRIWVGKNATAQQHILQAMHASGIGGHFGILATYQRIKRLFAWPKLKHTVSDYVSTCTVCQQAKTEHTKLTGLLQPLPIPPFPWHAIRLDFVEGLPKSHGFDVILVVIDKLTKYGHFLPLKHPFTAVQVAQTFLDGIYKLHGLPQCIISDRDKIFTSALWKELLKLTDTQLLVSSAYHPRTDGQTERLNQCLEAFLRCSAHATPNQLAKWLPLAEYWYNTSYHSALQRSPFETLYGHVPRHFGMPDHSTTNVQDLEDLLRNREATMALLQQQLLRAQERMRK